MKLVKIVPVPTYDVVNDDGSEMVFETKNSCLEFVKNNVTTDNPEDYLWEIPGEIECT